MFYYKCNLDVVYGPLSNRATTVVFEGIPTYPDVSRCWNIIDKYQINIFYTAPTAIRSLMQHSDTFVTRTSRQSLRLLGTVGEPINPEAWRWYNTIVGNGRCPIVDTWWQVSPSIDDYPLALLVYYRLKQVVL
jgi:acetyl-CoA synthetase